MLGVAIGLGREHLGFVLRLSAIVFIPLGLLGTLDETLSDVEAREDGLILVPIGVAALTLAGTSILGNLLFAGALAGAVVHTPRGSEPSIRRTIETVPWPTLIALDLLFASGLVLGLLALIVPGLIFFARYVLAAPLADIERSGVRDSFRRSAEISIDSRLLILILLGGAIVVGDMLQGVLGAIMSALGGSGFLADWLTSAGAQILASPIFGLVSVALVLVLTERRPAGSTRSPDRGRARGRIGVRNPTSP